MRTNLDIIRLFIFFCLISVPVCTTGAYNLRQFSSRNGLSNSAILSIGQDSQGFMWFGSCDGLNMFDGLNIQIYKPTNGTNNLSGNLIENIIETEKGILWVQTNYGLDRFDVRNKSIRSFKDFKRKNYLAVTRHKDIFIINEDDNVCYYDRDMESINQIHVPGLVFYNILDVVVDSKNLLWVFTKDNKAVTFTIRYEDNGINLEPVDIFNHEEDLLYCFHEGDNIYFIDKAYGLYEYNLISHKKYYIYDLYNEIKEHGEISSLVKHHDDYYIGFKTSGLLRLLATPELKTSFRLMEIDIKSGIFCMVKDKYQDVIWVGTDGQGVYMYFIDTFSIKSTLFNSLSYPVNNPVRGLFLDSNRTLWVGTKGDGILKIRDFDSAQGSYGAHNTEHLLTGYSLLNDNSVYAFAPSRKNILWIGSEGGLNYYSYTEKKVKKIPFPAEVGPVRYIHSICEANDSTLWMATVGDGIIRATLAGTPGQPVIRDARRILINEGEQPANYFFSIYAENDSVIWFGNRGYGAYRMDTRTETFEVYRFDEDGNNQTLNDIFSIIKNEEGYWFGTSYGLVHQNEVQKQIFNEANGFPNNTVHGILEDRFGNLWLSTNRGMVKFNMKQQTFQTYNQQNELEVIEFSDGAFYKDDRTGTLFFGGINGFITIRESDYAQPEYSPPILFNSLTIFGKDYNIHDFMSGGLGSDVLRLDYSQNFFAISFTAIDYINGNNYTYLYKLDELSDNWIENGNSNSATFTNISPGNYTLSVKYRNNITGKESAINTLGITIIPPWYMTRAAYLVYVFIVLLIILMAIRLTVKWYRMKKNTMIEKLNRQQKEEVYESKLRFFTNITHELCTPLTLIYGPCERIISHTGSDSYIGKYASLIMHNAEKLNSLIQELIEFRRLETGNKTIQVRNMCVSEYMEGILSSFSELAESRNIHYEIDIEPAIYWNTDESCLSKIITNLVSNAFKYTSDGGTIRASLFVREAILNIIIRNTGKGIKEENLTKMFDRYKILDDFEIQSSKGGASRNGLGLAICHSMVRLLDGEIKVRSVLNEFAEFHVILPGIHSETDEQAESRILRDEIPHSEVDIASIFDNRLPAYDKSKLTIMIIDDDQSMLGFVTEIFCNDYNVIPVQESDRVMELLKTSQPDLLISDIMMSGIDGISLAKTIKSDKLLSHIPLILLSARNDIEAQVEGVDSGAEVYITKPFNVKYLEKVVKRLIQRKNDLKEYYNSVYSSVEISEGKVLRKEEKEFFDRMLAIIGDHIEDPDLSIESVSSELGISSRQLYRKLKNVTDKTPNDIIREYRLDMAEKLLITTNLSVDEILYKAGFANRGNFYRLFSQRYGTTPKSYREEKQKELSAGEE